MNNLQNSNTKKAWLQIKPTLKIDSDTVKDMDSNLHIGGEVKMVYEELKKTLSEDHLKFDLVRWQTQGKINFHLVWVTGHLLGQLRHSTSGRAIRP